MMELLDGRFLEYKGLLQLLGITSLVFLFLTVAETIWDLVRKNRAGYGETAANAGIYIVNTLLERTLYGSLLVIILYGFEQLRSYQLPQTWWVMALAVLAADFTYYWMHRFEHEIRFLWAYHSVHHSSPEYNLTTALRLAWVEGLFEWVFFVPMVLIGFDVVQTTLGLLIVVIYQTWIHTQKIGKMGWLDKVFNTPSAHRVHHGKNPQYIDKNYGGILMVWDRMFDTYEPEGEQVEFGITAPPGSTNPIMVNFFEFSRTIKDAMRAKSFRLAVSYLIKPPGWAPKAEDKD